MESFETERNDQTLSAMIYVKRMFLSPHLALCLHRCCFLRRYFMCARCARYNICRYRVRTCAFTDDSRQGSFHLYVHLQNNVGLLHPETRDAR